jgi:CBS domain-containing protein
MLVRTVLDAKKKPVISIGPEATVREALALFVEHNIGSLPVIDASGKLIGIFTERDVLYGDHRESGQFHARLIKGVMTPSPFTCSSDDGVHEVMGKMSRQQVGQLPVVDHGELIGLVSVGDLIRAQYNHVEAENEHLNAYLYGPG